jgi:formyltetrahydrofolate hydrolase
MTEIPQLTKILDKTKHLLKEFNLPLDLLRVNKDSKESHLQTILQSLDEAIKYVILTRGY